MSPWEGQRPACAHCGKRPRQLSTGYCETTCYRRWVRAGRPESGPPPDGLALWRQLPVAESDRRPADLDVGTAGEHLVCADLLLNGYVAFRTDQGCAYDIALDLGQRLIRIQVKTTRGPNSSPKASPAYEWHIRKRGFGGRTYYPDGAFDLLALVAMDIRQVAYMPPSAVRTMARIRPPGAEGSLRFNAQFSDYPFGRALGYVLNPPPQDAPQDVQRLAAGERSEG